MEEETTKGMVTPVTAAGDEVKTDKVSSEGGDHAEEEHAKESESVQGEHLDVEHMIEEAVEGEHLEKEQVEEEYVEGKGEERNRVKGEHLKEAEDTGGNDTNSKYVEGEEKPDEKKEEAVEEFVEEEEVYVEEPPPDPAAPFEFSDSREALKPKFELRPDQIAEVEQLWEIYQNYTPAYTNIHGYITQKELVYMLNCLLLMTYTPEQLQELIVFCCRPPHPEGHITYDQFLKMVTIRQRDFPIDEELHKALEVMDPEHTGAIDREYFKDSLSKLGNRLPQRQLDNFIKEVDIANDGTIGIEDVVGTLCIDLNRDEIIMMQNQLNPNAAPEETQDEF